MPGPYTRLAVSLRDTNLERLAGEDHDVLVVGAGINGAVAGAVLAARGARVALIDSRDFGGFTSEQSSNLVWGGIKYLENYEFGLVRHLCTSRNRLLRAYPANVREIRFLGALDQSAPRSPPFVALGALAYWLIGNGATRPPHLLSRSAVGRREPAIAQGTLRGGVEYSDAYLIDNDSRFVFGFVRQALNAGAAAANYVHLLEAERSSGMWVARVRDEESGTELAVRARTLVNATGPFVDALNTGLGTETERHLVLSKGIHLVVPRVGTNERVLAFYDDTGRLFFVIPMGHRSVIGTTDTRVEGPNTEVTAEDRAFLLRQINERLDLDSPITVDDVIAERCGVRPLVVERGAAEAAESAHWTALSRRHALEVDEQRSQITVFGGKLTDCLNVGREIYDLARGLGVPLSTYRRDWYGEPSRASRREFDRQAGLMKVDELATPTIGTLTERLWRRYGLRAFTMLEAIRHDPAMAEPVIDETDYLRCELELGAPTEMVTRLEDFLRRRSKIAMVVGRERLADADGLDDACRLLFGDNARAKRRQYFDGV